MGLNYLISLWHISEKRILLLLGFSERIQLKQSRKGRRVTTTLATILKVRWEHQGLSQILSLAIISFRVRRLIPAKVRSHRFFSDNIYRTHAPLVDDTLDIDHRPLEELLVLLRKDHLLQANYAL